MRTILKAGTCNGIIKPLREKKSRTMHQKYSWLLMGQEQVMKPETCKLYDDEDDNDDDDEAIIYFRGMGHR